LRLEGPELGVHRTILAALETNANSQFQTFGDGPFVVTNEA